MRGFVKYFNLIFFFICMVNLFFAIDYAVIVDSNEFRYFHNELVGYSNSAREIVKLLSNIGYNTSFVTGKNISDDDIIEEIKSIIPYSNEEDSLLLFFSGSVFSPKKNDEFGFMTYNSYPDSTENSFLFRDLTTISRDYKGRKILILDIYAQDLNWGLFVHNITSLLDSFDLLFLFQRHFGTKKGETYIGSVLIEEDIISYFIKKVLEGEADNDRNNVVSAFEFSNYLSTNLEYLGEENKLNYFLHYKSGWAPIFIIGEPGGSIFEETSLEIITEPEEAEIYINDYLLGTSPLVVSEIEEGNYKLFIRKEGFEDYSDFISVMDGGNKLEVILRAEKTEDELMEDFSEMHIFSEPGNKLYLEDECLGTFDSEGYLTVSVPKNRKITLMIKDFNGNLQSRQYLIESDVIYDTFTLSDMGPF